MGFPPLGDSPIAQYRNALKAFSVPTLTQINVERTEVFKPLYVDVVSEESDSIFKCLSQEVCCLSQENRRIL